MKPTAHCPPQSSTEHESERVCRRAGERVKPRFGVEARSPFMALSSAHAFIRALKAPSDPPPSESQTKVELARAAWNTPALYIPSKAEVLVDWLLSQLLKNTDS